MHLQDIENLYCEEEVSTSEFISLAKEVLGKGGVDRTVAVSGGRVVEGCKLLQVLKRLGVRRVPVSLDVEKIFVPLEVLGFFEDIQPSTYRVFRDTEELLYRNWPTPLVRLSRASIRNRIVWAKLEGFNPWSMSVKDRIGWYMYRRAIETYGRRELGFLVESTSTNTGLAIAAMANMYNSRLRAYIPSTVSQSGEHLLKIFGVEVVRSSKPLTIELIDDVEDVAKREGAVHLNQFYNDANFAVHLRYTAKELELQIREAGIFPKAIVGGLGTSGHLSAIAIYFKSRFRGVRIYGVVPKEGTAIQGIRRIESGMKWLHYADIDGIVEASPEEALQSVLYMVRREGIFVGLSSGAVYTGYRKLVESGELDEGDYILVFPDHGYKYIEQLQKYLANT
uniref:Pyridoxal-phosphate dependent enzyme n=1 Tax=Ignisphaera aggregans TaxID=334771 RepID=A0A7J3I9G7_9CREN